MKEYIKPQFELIRFDSESILSSENNGKTDVVSSDVVNPWGTDGENNPEDEFWGSS